MVDQYLANEVSLGRVAGPFSVPPYPNLHVSSFGVIPKRGQPGKWRLIVDLSSPGGEGGGASVNDGIDLDKFTLHYITVDQVIRLVSKLGPGAHMAKFDVEAAYHNVPVHPSHCILLDLVLPFGLRSAPFIFNSIANMEWILLNSYQIPDLLHYLDNFITAGPAQSLQRTEFGYCSGGVSTAWSTVASWQVCGPLYSARCLGY